MTITYNNKNYNLYTLVVTYLDNRVVAYPVLSSLNKLELVEATRKSFFKYNKQAFIIPNGRGEKPAINYFKRTDFKNWKIS